GMDAPLALRYRHPLHPMDAAFEFEVTVGALARHFEDDLPEPSAVRLSRREHFGLPALPFRVTRVHPEQVRRKQRRLVAAGAGPDLDADGLPVVRLLWHQQPLDPAQQLLALASQ